MGKISIENKKGKITITNKLSAPETLNERVCNAIASGVFEGFLPLSVRQKRKETIIECVVQDLIPLSQYFGGLVTRKMFLDFVHDIALYIKNCEKNMINANNLELQADMVFIDPQSKRVSCIYWPVVNNQRGVAPQLFLRQLPSEIKINPHEDCKFLDTYVSFFNSGSPFSVNNFDRLVLSLAGKRIMDGPSTPSGSLAGSSKQLNNAPYIGGSVNIEYDPFSNNFNSNNNNIANHVQNEVKQNPDTVICSSCGAPNQAGSNFCVRCGAMQNRPEPVMAPPPPPTPSPSPYSIPAQMTQMSYPDDDSTTVLGAAFSETTVLGYDEPQAPMYPKLIRLRTEQIYPVDKPAFRIGTEQSYCDLFICDNNYISRSHADIISRDGRYFIVDKNSTNRTYVDGKVIPPEREVELFAGTRIRLANDDFVFEIES